MHNDELDDLSLINLVFRVTGKYQEAEDINQDVFTKV